MFIASTLKTDKNGKYMDEDLDLVPFDEEYCNISADELETASKQNKLNILSAKDNNFSLDKKSVRNILDEIKNQIKNRITVLD